MEKKGKLSWHHFAFWHFSRGVWTLHPKLFFLFTFCTSGSHHHLLLMKNSNNTIIGACFKMLTVNFHSRYTKIYTTGGGLKSQDTQQEIPVENYTNKLERDHNKYSQLILVAIRKC